MTCPPLPGRRNRYGEMDKFLPDRATVKGYSSAMLELCRLRSCAVRLAVARRHTLILEGLLLR